MYHKTTGSYDDIPDGMKIYLNNYGCHFNKKLCEEAVSRMYTKAGGKKAPIEPYTKERTEGILKANGIVIDRGKLYDATYVINMGKADFLGKSIPDESHLAMYVKDVLDDADAVDGYVFNRFIADCMFMNNPIEWEDVI